MKEEAGNHVVIFDSPMKHPDGYYWSHMTASNLQYLHEFASKIGLKREWFQDKPGRPHYDIKTDIIRRRASKNGAQLVGRSFFVTKIKEWHTLK